MGRTSSTGADPFIRRAVAARPPVRLVPGRCPFGHPRVQETYSLGFDYEYHSTPNEWRGVRCAECGTWYLDPRPAEEDFQVIYPADYVAYGTSDDGNAGRLVFRAKGWIEQRKIRRYARFISGVSGDVLDVGCGDGLLLDGFRRAGFPPSELAGVELHPYAAELSRRKGYRVVEGDFERTDLGGERYRLVVMNQLVEHLVDPIAGLRRVHSILRPGGVLFLETPNLDSLNARIASRRTWGGYHYPRHLHLFSPSTIEAALHEAGLELVEIRYLPCPVQWVLTLNNALQERQRPPRVLLRFLDWKNPVLLGIFTIADLLLLPLGTANMQVVGRRPS